MTWVTTLLVMLLPLPALALSCKPYGVTNAYLNAEQSTERFIVVRGALSFDTSVLPVVDPATQDAPDLTRVPATISGEQWGASGARTPFAASVTMEVACFGPWCATAQQGDALTFLRQEGEAFVLATDPCGGYLFGAPVPEQLDAVQACLDGGTCTARRFP